MPANPRPALEVHHALKTAIAAWEQAERNAVVCFAEVLRRRLYRELGYSSIQQYARMELNFSDTRTGDFVRLVHKMDELPVLREAIENGDVGYTKAREIITVATPKTDANWVEAARRQSRAELADKVKKVKDKAARRRKTNPAQTELLPVPTETVVREVSVRVSLEMTPEQYARYEKLMTRLGSDNKVEAVLEGLAGTLDRASVCDKESCAESAPRGVTPVQIVVHKCPDCDEAVIPTNRGELKISKEEFDRLQEDAQVYVDGGKNTSTIPPKLRLQALARDRHRCAAPGCRHTHFLHVHHVAPRELGGSNDLSNLITLCSGCHRQHHRHDGPIRKPSAPHK